MAERIYPNEIPDPKAEQTGIYPKIHKKGLRDRVEVFLYNHLAAMVSPHPEVLLTPTVRAALVEDINWLVGGYGFPPDLQQILNAFILTHINQISVSTLSENAVIAAQIAAQTTLVAGITPTPTSPITPTTPTIPITPTTSTPEIM